MTATLVISRLYSPVDVLTFTFLTRPSGPGKTSVILPMDHLPRTVLLSATRTTSFTCKFQRSTCHCFLCTRDEKTSLLQRFQNESTIFWTNSTLWWGFRDFLNDPCATSGDALEEACGKGIRSQLPFPNVLPLYSNKWTGRHNAQLSYFFRSWRCPLQSDRMLCGKMVEYMALDGVLVSLPLTEFQ